MGAPILTPRTMPATGPSGLAPDLVHTDVIRIPGGAEFAAGWVDDTPQTSIGATTRQKDGE